MPRSIPPRIGCHQMSGDAMIQTGGSRNTARRPPNLDRVGGAHRAALPAKPARELFCVIGLACEGRALRHLQTRAAPPWGSAAGGG
jgi:hypothetical protein